jgi:hypothetical protein
VVGNTITLTFTSSENISTPVVTIAGNSTAVTGGPTAWSATHAVVPADALGTVAFSITFSDQAGNAGTDVTATTDASSVTRTRAGQTIGTITFDPVSLATGGTTAASATASSGLAVTFSSDTTSVCTVTGGNTVNGVTAGTCTIRASQAGDGTYSPAVDVTQDLEVTSTSSTITITFAGTGTGTAFSTSTPDSPDQITDCPGPDCTGTFDSGTEVTLRAATNWKSSFVSWFPTCTGGSGATCIFTPSGDIGVTATFNLNGHVKFLSGVNTNEYGSLQDIYNVATNGDTIVAHVFNNTENFTANLDIALTLDLGKDSSYLNPSGHTTLQGALTIERGQLTISNLIIQ